MKHLILSLLMLAFSSSAFAVNPGFLTGVVTVTSGFVTEYNVVRSTDTTLINAHSPTDDANGIFFHLPATATNGDTYLIEDKTNNCSDGYLNVSTVVDVKDNAKEIDGFDEWPVTQCDSGFFIQYTSSDDQYHVIGFYVDIPAMFGL